VLLVVLAVLAWPSVAAAQMSARVRGVIMNVDGEPVEGATVTFTFQGGVNREQAATTNAEGEYMQMGLQSGPYRIVAAKDGVGERTEEITLRVGQQEELDIQLVPVGMRAVSDLTDEERAEYERAEALLVTLEAAVELATGGDFGAAITAFEEGLSANPDCFQCYHGIGMAYLEQEEYGDAEAAFNSSLEVNPDYAEAYEGLATIYNTQRRFDEAVAASERAAELSGGGGLLADPDTVFNQGLINWNAGNIEEAKAQFAETLELDPNHGEAHYWVGMANLNEGNLAGAKTEFERYIELEPDGRFADQARGMVTQLP
tara:strand:+ start:2709 stop:3656 length:948 start_codon:yes stop_codon:yes gene_type:complete